MALERRLAEKEGGTAPSEKGLSPIEEHFPDAVSVHEQSPGHSFPFPDAGFVSRDKPAVMTAPESPVVPTGICISELMRAELYAS